MGKSKSIIFIIVIWLAVIFSGCAGKQVALPTPTPPQGTPTVTVTATPKATAPLPEVTPTVPTPVTTFKELPPNTLYVEARMSKPAYWGDEKYELRSLQATIYNQRNIPLSIKAQIISGGQILEEKFFTLQEEGSGYQMVNNERHFMNSTNVTLRLLVQGYQPVEYKVIEAASIG